MSVYQYLNFVPSIADGVYIAPGSIIVGDVSIAHSSSVWYNAVIRGDVDQISIGSYTNIQDNSVVHTSRMNGPCHIGDYVTVGHSCIIHACTLMSNSFVGMGATILDTAIVEEYGFVAANALVSSGKVVKSYELWGGVPARFIKKLTDVDIEFIKDNAVHYVNLAQKHRDNKLIY